MFDTDELPKIYNAMLIKDWEGGICLAVEAALHGGDNGPVKPTKR